MIYDKEWHVIRQALKTIDKEKHDMRIELYLTTICMILIFSQTIYAGMESTHYSIPTSVLSGGGTPMTSSSFQTNGTIGQPSPLNPGLSTTFEVNPGFWYTLSKSNCIWDIFNDNDGDVDGVDLYRFINAYDLTDLKSFTNEFGRTDCSN